MNFDIIEVVIQKLVRTFRLSEWSYDVEDFAEDIAESLKLIGAASLFEDKVAEITIHQQMGKVPLDCQHIKHLIPVNTPYKESGNFIVVDAPDNSKVYLTYQSMPTDARGLPLVPDNAAVREAIMWYLAKILVLQGELPKISYQMAEQEWQWRCGSARAELSVMGVVAWSGVANDYLRLNPIKDVHVNNYKELGKPNTLHRDSRLQGDEEINGSGTNSEQISER